MSEEFSDLEVYLIIGISICGLSFIIFLLFLFLVKKPKINNKYIPRRQFYRQRAPQRPMTSYDPRRFY